MKKQLAVIAVLALLAAPGDARAEERLWSLLKTGGQVVLMPHAVTTPGAGDPPGMCIDDCGTQRNLTDEGRQHARLIGDTFRARGIQIDRVLASLGAAASRQRNWRSAKPKHGNRLPISSDARRTRRSSSARCTRSSASHDAATSCSFHTDRRLQH